MKYVLVFLTLNLFSILTYADSINELEGICDLEPSAASCEVINNTAFEIRQLSWLLQGDVDYNEDKIINLKPYDATLVTNSGKTDNCLFTEFTDVWAYYNSDESLGQPSATLNFDSSGNCTIEINK